MATMFPASVGHLLQGDQGIDKAKIEQAIRDIIEAIGEDPEREGLKETPQRVAQMYAEVFSGLAQSPDEELMVSFDEGHQEMVLVRDLSVFSICEHHLLPFFGIAHIAYIPQGRVVGASKIARVLDVLARRPQIQERLANQVADALMTALQARGSAVIIQAEHLCMTMRGIRRPGSSIVTSALRGEFQQDAATRAEFFSLVGK